MGKTNMKVLVINGPNLNMLGKRDKSQYGTFTLSEINKKIEKYAKTREIITDFFQSNIEGEIIDKIQNSNEYDAIIINAGGYTHTSVSIRDAINDSPVPFIEVHLSNITSRENFRHNSMLSPVCKCVVMGLKEKSYLAAIDSVFHILN